MHVLIMPASEKGKKFRRLKKHTRYFFSDLSCSIERCINYYKCVFFPFFSPVFVIVKHDTVCFDFV